MPAVFHKLGVFETNPVCAKSNRPVGAITPTPPVAMVGPGNKSSPQQALPEVIMSMNIKLIGIAISLTAALGGFGLLGAGESTPAVAAPAVLAHAAPAALDAKPAEARPVEASLGIVQDKPAIDCTKQAWPYVARECLAAAEGTPVRKVTRTITANVR